MRKIIPLIILCGSIAAISLNGTRTAVSVPVAAAPVQETAAPVAEQFRFTDATGNVNSVPLVDDSAKRRLTVNPSLERAATIAQERANAHSRSMCWRYVKQALLAAGAVDSYPQTEFAKEAGAELVNHYGFKALPVTNPYDAPVGAVLVYTADNAPGHVEIRTETGFVSDFKTDKASKRKLIGVYAKA
ncbi:MAG: hypothetical protein M3Y80_08065 [Verrucomicrobiota bacterium]|nr:hypothetical protein [Verrucomicrobiota bacterium]